MNAALYRPLATVADFTARIRLGTTTESVVLDFKRDLDKWKAPNQKERQEGQKEFCRDVSQFANSVGGSLLLGIDEAESSGLRVADRVHSLDDFDARRGWMEQAVSNYMIPSSTRLFIDPLHTADGLVIAVNVPPSERLVMVWDRSQGTIECLRRNNHGKARMSPEELEASLMDNKRAVALALRRVSDQVREVAHHNNVDLASSIWIDPPMPGTSRRRVRGVNVQLTALSEYEFELHVTVDTYGTRVLRVPYGLLREVWFTSDTKIGMFLDAMVVVSSNHIGLELP